MTFHLLTIFPDIFSSYLDASILKRGVEGGHLVFNVVNIRDFATDKHRMTDDIPYGGGAGMVMKPEPIFAAVEFVHASLPADHRVKTYLLSAKGERFTQRVAEACASEVDDLILICGRYEGVDERVAEFLVDGELSIGPFVLAGGELAALVVAESVARLIPGVLGNPSSLTQESFAIDQRTGEYPQYTRPEVFRDHHVPEILLSGNHGEIAAWRSAHQTHSTESA